MRRVPVIAIAVLVLAACGGGDEGAEPAQEEEAALRVGLVTDIGQLNDRGFNQLAFEGL